MKKVLVSGASGYIGEKLIEKLLAQKYSIRCLIRKNTSYTDYLKKKKIELHYGDITKPETLLGVCNDIDIVYHLAAKTESFFMNSKDYYDVNYLGTKNIVTEAIKSKVELFVYLSSFSVFGIIKNRKKPFLTQKCNPFTIYGKSKYAAENFCLSLSKKQLPVLILRPSMVYDFDELKGDLRILNYFVKFKFVPVLGNGKNCFNIISRENLTELVIKMSKTKKTGLFLASDEIITTNELIERLMEENNIKNLIKVYIPIRMLSFPVKIYEKLFKALGLNPLITSDRLKMIELSK